MIPVAQPVLGQKELENVVEAVRSGWVSSKGKFVAEFESRFAAYCGAKHGIATFNGTVSLHLALTALGIGRGDEVIVPTLTFVATANAVAYTGARPVFVDSHPDYWCMDPEGVEKAVTPKTKAIIPVHLYGHPCDMDPILDTARRRGLHVLEDAAEAHGAEYKGRKVGSFGEINCFSFYGNKMITTGEGGMCLTDDAALAEKLNHLKDHGMSPSRRYWHDILAFNYRMTNLQAALGAAQMDRLDEFVQEKTRIARKYNSLLAGTPGVVLPPEMPWARNVYWMYSVVFDARCRRSRDEVAEELARRGIDTRPFFHPMHLMPPHKRTRRYPVAESLAAGGLNLPSSANLKDLEIEFIASSLKEAISG